MNRIRQRLLILGLSVALAGEACADGKTGKAPAPSVAAKPAASPLRAQPMRGPFPDLAAFCKTLKPAPERCLNEAPDQEGNGFASLKEPQAPYRAVRLFAAGGVGWYAFYLGVQTEKGWFVQDMIEAVSDTKVRELLLEQSAPALGPLVRLRLAGANLMPAGPGSERTMQMCFEQLLLCGVGGSQIPSCLPSLRVANTPCKDFDGSQPMPPWDWQVRTAWKGAKEFELALQGTADFTAPTKLLGTHALVFP